MSRADLASRGADGTAAPCVPLFCQKHRKRSKTKAKAIAKSEYGSFLVRLGIAVKNFEKNVQEVPFFKKGTSRKNFILRLKYTGTRRAVSLISVLHVRYARPAGRAFPHHRGVPHDIRPQFGCAFLQQQHDRRAAVLEITLLLPARKAAVRLHVADAADEHRADFNLYRVPERAGAQRRDGAGILLINIIPSKRNRVDRVQHAGDVPSPGKEHAVVEKAVAMIVAHRQAENQACPAAESTRLYAVTQQRGDRIRRPLDEKHAPVIDRIGAQTCIGRSNERTGIRIERTSARLDLTGKEIIEAAVIPRLVVPHINLIPADKARNHSF